MNDGARAWRLEESFATLYWTLKRALKGPNHPPGGISFMSR